MKERAAKGFKKGNAVTKESKEANHTGGDNHSQHQKTASERFGAVFFVIKIAQEESFLRSPTALAYPRRPEEPIAELANKSNTKSEETTQ